MRPLGNGGVSTHSLGKRGLSDGRGTFKRMLAKTHTEVCVALTPVVTGLIGVGGRIGGVLGADFLERPRAFPLIFRKTATGRYRETERQEQ